MAITTFFFAGTAQGDFVQHGYIILDDGSLTHNKSGTMVQQNTATNARRRVYIHPKHFTPYTLEQKCQQVPSLLPQQVCYAVCSQGMKTFEKEQRLQGIVAGCITINNCHDICRKTINGRGIIAQDGPDKGLQIISTYIAARQLARQTNRYGAAK